MVRIERILTLCAVTSFLALPSIAQERYPHSAESQNLGVNVYLVPDKSEFLKAWTGPTPPRFYFLSKVRRGAPFALVVIFWGTTPDNQGHCQLFMDLRITDGKNRMAGKDGPVPVCVDHPPPPKGRLGLGDVIVDLSTGGAAGEIRIETRFTDRVSKSSLSVVVPLGVTE